MNQSSSQSKKNRIKKYLILSSFLILTGALPLINNACNDAFFSQLNQDSTQFLPLIQSNPTPFVNSNVSNLREISIQLREESSDSTTSTSDSSPNDQTLEAIVSLFNTETNEFLSIQKTTTLEKDSSSQDTYALNLEDTLKFYIPKDYDLQVLSLIVEAPGYETKKIAFSSLDLNDKLIPINLRQENNNPTEESNTLTSTAPSGDSGPEAPTHEDPNQEDPSVIGIEMTPTPPNPNLFHYNWKSDGSGLELEQTMGEPRKPQIEFLNESITPSNLSYASTVLENNYNLILSNNGDIPWSANLSQRLLKTIHEIPHRKYEHKVFVELSSLNLANDISITKERVNNELRVTKITLSSWAFNYSSPKLVKLDGKVGKFFSRRLFHAMVIFFTDRGRNKRAIKKILLDKFALELHEEVKDYESLTATNEPKEHFQSFQPNEMIFLISAMVEMPEGYYKVPGLRYLLRRKEGHPHPLYPTAPAVAWPRGPNSDSYVEFMTSAFSSQGPDYIHRLILHEKSHFIYRNLLDENTHRDWQTVGGWFINEADNDGWSTTQTTTFVSPYAHAHNPSEDFAESVSYYVINPQKILNFAPDKYEFIASRIMNGYRYHTQIQEHLTFQVLNLYPDYDFPGKIREVDVKARGKPTQDKTVTIQLKLHNHPDFNDGARYAYTRITSPAGTFKDLYMYPVNGNRHTLRGTLTIPSNAAQGYWTVDQIVLTDQVRNQRMQGINDFGFKLYINNPGEDLSPPEYVRESLEITSRTTQVENKNVYHINISWDIHENMDMRNRSSVSSNLVYSGTQRKDIYPLFNYGDTTITEEVGSMEDGTPAKKFKANVLIKVTDFFRNGKYEVTHIGMTDKALNRSGQPFSDSRHHEPLKFISIDTQDPDLEKPVVDLNDIQITAEPINPSNPNGETSVRINYRAKDNKSGVGKVYYLLLDPVGKTHHYSHRHRNFFTLFFKGGDPTQYKDYEVSQMLPRGSAPGTWGLKEMIVEDKAGNIRSYNFSEVVHFQVIDD